MPSTPTSTSTAAERVLHCSPARTVLERTDANGARVVAKLFVAGALADAEREFACAQLAAGDGVVEHLAAGIDTASNRPCVTTRFEAGVDLDRLVAQRGAVPAALACELLAPVAGTLARLHALRVPAAPLGLCHGDVKPKNLLRTAATTLLLDFEHAQPIAPARHGAKATFGTRGFAAPEAQGATVATAALDVWALGATLAWLLRGGDARARVPQHPRVERLLAACMAADPSARPDAASVARELRELTPLLASDASELALDDWAHARPRGDDGDAADDPRTRPGRARRRLLARLPQLTTLPTGVPAEPGPLRVALAAAQSVLRRFPRHAPTLAWRRDLLLAAGRMLAAAPHYTAVQGKQEAFAAAATWLDELERLVRLAASIPGGLVIPSEDGGAPGLSQREPLALLERLRAQVAAADAELQDELARIAAAERRLDLRGAEAAVEAMAARHGGASPTAARQRDRLHRLAFYIDRVARAEANVERVAATWDATALQPLTTLVAAAAAARARTARPDAAASTVGLRSLQLTLVNLAEEFPHLPPVAPALEALTQALAHLTDRAWELLAQARQHLQSSPVPVRPLQLTLGRLDTYRVLEAFLDRPDRPRSQLLDHIEALRLALEQARATRDRLAESAEQAMARGHWTTGLFDMERAVAGMQPDEQDRAEATRLQERLEAARRRKQELETTVRRNVDLATLYAGQQDDPASTFVARLQALEERRGCLLFLAMHVPAERSVLYHRDLREVDTQIALERAAVAEHELDGTVDPHERLRLARATLEQLAESVTQGEQAVDPPGRVVRLLEHWRTVAAHCQRAVDHARSEQQARARQRRRAWMFMAAAVIATTAAIAFAVRPWLQGAPAQASGGPEPPGAGK